MNLRLLYLKHYLWPVALYFLQYQTQQSFLYLHGYHWIKIESVSRLSNNLQKTHKVISIFIGYKHTCKIPQKTLLEIFTP